MAEKMFRHGVRAEPAEVQARRGGQSKRGSGEMPAEQESSWAVEQERFMGGALVAGRPSLLCLTEDRRGNIFWNQIQIKRSKLMRHDYLPQDYALTDHDLCAHIAVESSLSKELLVRIDRSYVLQNQLMCLLDEKEWVNDDNDNKVYVESPFVTSLLRRDGNLGIQEDSAFMTNIVQKYMEYDMIELPINASNMHWYLAIVNTKKREIQVLDSLCWKFVREDLAITLREVQFHLDILKSQNLIKDDWKDVDLTE
uniref:Ubiquitin-like protease family profile domain-containing protein n=1 Tax=Aegilops tauschii TaxID=37682 RepID=M8AWB0_AEGTA